MKYESWPSSKNAHISMSSKASNNAQPTTSEFEIDAIASNMDNIEKENKSSEIINQNNQNNINSCINPTPENMAQIMIQNYIRQNGGVVVQQPVIENKNNKLLLG